MTLVVADFFLRILIGSTGYILASLLAFVAWIWVFKASFRTGWLGSLAIAILAVIIFIVLSVVLGAVLGLLIPAHQLFPTF